MEEVLHSALCPGRAPSDYDVMVSALISSVFVIAVVAQEKNFKVNGYSFTYFKEND